MGRDYLGGAAAGAPGGPSSAAAEPLLGAAAAAYASPLLPRAARQPRDRAWALSYLLLVSVALAGGLYAAAHHSPDFAHGLNPKYLADPAHCPAPPSGNSSGGGNGGRALLAALALGGGGGDAPPSPPPPPPPPPPAFSPRFFVAAASFYVAASVAGGVLLGVAAMCLYRARPRAAVYGAIALQVGLPLAGALGVLASGAPLAAASPFLLAAGLVGFVYFLYRAQLGLVAQLLGTAAQAVSHVWGVVAAAAGLQLASALVSLPLAASALMAYANGAVVRSPLAARVVEGGGGGGDAVAQLQCLSASGDAVLCCAWQPKPWASLLAGACAVALAWTSLLGFCVKTYTVSGAVAAWYFAPANSTLETSRATSSALKNALGPSLGTNALAAWLLALIGWARAALQQLREQARDSFVAQLLLSCVDAAYSVLEQLSKFAVVYSAISGDDFFTAARQSTSLLSRNLLDTVAVWVFPANVVGLTNLALGAAWAAAAGFSSYHLAFAPQAARAVAEGAVDAGPVAVQSAVVVGVVAFAFGYAALAFLASVLLSAVDAAYLCFAIDRDRHVVTREEVHAVMVLLPASGKGGPGGGVVEHPGGGLAFGAEHGRSGPAAV
jgi:hypothetical protein